jgi:hypothetical protein
VDCALAGLGVGRPEVVTERVMGRPPRDGLFAADELEEVLGRGSTASGMSGRGFLVFGIGRAGSGPEGGASGARRGRWGIADVIVVVRDNDMVPSCVSACVRLYACV